VNNILEQMSIPVTIKHVQIIDLTAAGLGWITKTLAEQMTAIPHTNLNIRKSCVSNTIAYPHQQTMRIFKFYLVMKIYTC